MIRGICSDAPDYLNTAVGIVHMDTALNNEFNLSVYRISQYISTRSPSVDFVRGTRGRGGRNASSVTGGGRGGGKVRGRFGYGRGKGGRFGYGRGGGVIGGRGGRGGRGGLGGGRGGRDNQNSYNNNRGKNHNHRVDI